jgi:hypothetical protein
VLAAVAPALLSADSEKKVLGDYSVRVGGYYAGEGEATANEAGVFIRARVHREGSPNATVTLVAPNLKLDGAHFSGTGRIGGKPFKFAGRLDGYSGDKTFKGARILCTYTPDPNNPASPISDQVGRIAGVLH